MEYTTSQLRGADRSSVPVAAYVFLNWFIPPNAGGAKVSLMLDFQQSREAMINGQLRPNKIGSAAVIAAIRAVPREMFVPKSMRAMAYVDEDIEIAPGRWLMEPVVFGRLLQAAEIKDTDAVLDIGSLTGYSTSVFSHLANVVVGVEEDADTVAKANTLLTELELGNAAVVQGALVDGYAKEAPFDVIYIGGAVERIPHTLIDQLAEGGRLIAVQVKNGVGRAVLGTKIAGVFGLKDFMDAQCPLLEQFILPDTFSF
jgi:protein-L-isoaspartate(D-aspartate) O-methyltransferase